jgi:hypothetical protein
MQGLICYSTTCFVAVRHVSVDHYAAVDMDDLAADVARVRAGKEYEASGDFDGLAGSLHRHRRSELLDRVLGHRRRDERRPDRPRRDRCGI